MTGALSPEELSKRMQLDTIRNREVKILGAVALDGTGLKEGLQWLSEKIKGK